MTPVLTETTDACCVCGDVCCERDRLYVDYDDEVDDLPAGSLVCRDCAE